MRKSKQRHNNETILNQIDFGQEINAVNDIENLSIKNKYNFACCDCSKKNSIIGILMGTLGFGVGTSCQNFLCFSAPKAVILKLIVVSLLLISVGGAISGIYSTLRKSDALL